MNKSILSGAIVGAAVATAGGVLAGYKMLQDDEQPVVAQTAPVPVEECEPNPDEPGDKNRIAGTAIGALVGGAVGRDLGDRDITTAAGAAAGALAGNQIQKKVQENKASESGC
jgi:uncharacterized protein YcfJ